MALSAEMQELVNELKSSLLADLSKDILPIIDSAAKAAVSAASPVAAVFADPIIDEIDAYVAQLLGNAIPTVTAPTDTASQIASLQQHVAALTVSTGAATSSSLTSTKLAVQTNAASNAIAAAKATS